MALFACAVAPAAVPAQVIRPDPGRAASEQRIIRDSIPGTLVSFELVLVPGGSVTVDGPDGPRAVQVAPFWIGRTEVTWDMYDVYMLRLDTADSSAAADAVARPSKPYAVPDYEWGHDGFAAISIARGAAESFARWLSERTGHRYRLPTEAEWLHAAAQAAGPALTAARLDAIAWHAGNADRQTHAIASKEPDALGLYDLFGNAAEWVVPEDGRLVTRGGSFRDPVDAVGPAARAAQTERWTERDPQLPRSVWWLSDAPFVGFRLVREH
jgi:formylglycine-generating enzyme required for sulfatase activity